VPRATVGDRACGGAGSRRGIARAAWAHGPPGGDGEEWG
jgi:hypothetical protein